LKTIAIVVLVLTAFRSAVADWNDVPTGSMKPTIVEGDRIFVNKLAYGLKVPFTTWHLARWSTPSRGEVVVFNSPVDGTRLVKRVVGLPGDQISMINDELYVNGQPLTYQPIPGTNDAIESLGDVKHTVMTIPSIRAMRSFAPTTIPAGQYFMMGDNRDNSADSRYIGTVPLDQIVGRSSYVAMSFDYDNFYLPRFGRFFHSLDPD